METKIIRNSKLQGRILTLIGAGLLLFLPSCASTVVQEIKVIDAEVSGPINQIPVSLSDGSAGVKISTKAALLMNAEDITGFVGDEESQRAGIISNKNFKWNLNNFALSVNADLPLSRGLALMAGGSYSATDEFSQFSWLGGFGLYGHDGSTGVRLDAGIIWNSMNFAARTRVITVTTPPFGSSSVTDTIFFRDKDECMSVNPFVTLTFNIGSRDNLVNFYFGGIYFTQTVLNFSPRKTDIENNPLTGQSTVIIDEREKATAAFAGGQTGLSFKLSNSGRVVMGLQILKEMFIKDSPGEVRLQPVIQADFRF